MNLVPLVVLLSAIAPPPVEPYELLRPRDLPAIQVLWSWPSSISGLSVRGGIAYVVSYDRVTAIETATGKSLWVHELSGSSISIGPTEPVLVGRLVAVPAQTKVLFLDQETGALRSETDLGQMITALVGPPVVALAGGFDEPSQLVLMNPESGAVDAQHSLGTGMGDLRIEKDTVLATMRNWMEEGTTVFAFDATDLRQRWQKEVPSFSHFEKIGPQLYAYFSAAECGAEGERFRIDPLTGRLGELLPQREPGDAGRGFDWELQSVWIKADESVSRLRRNSLENAKAIWNHELPCAPKAFLRTNDTLYLSCARSSARGLLLALDWESGEIRHAAYGLRAARSLHDSKGVILAVTSTSLVGISKDRFGEPESRRPVEGEAFRLLAQLSARSLQEEIEAPPSEGEVTGVLEDLQALGSEAFPTLSRQISGASPKALAAIARILGDGGFRSAAPLLRNRLGEPSPPEIPWGNALDPQVEILRALSQIGSGDDVQAIADVLGDQRRSGASRRQALAALASLKTPSALRALNKLVPARREARRTRWQPPAPPPEASSEPTPEEFAKAFASGDSEILLRVTRSVTSGRLSLPDGRTIVVFTDPSLGRIDDLWMAEIDASGRAQSSYFLGRSVPEYSRDGLTPKNEDFAVRLEGEVLLVDGSGGKGRGMRISLRDVRRDSDGDGLTDLVEQRLGTDPFRADTDGDGLTDSEDPAPVATRRVPRDERDEIIAAIFEQFFLFERNQSSSQLAVVVGTPSLEWSGRSGPTITMSEEQLKPTRPDEIPFLGAIQVRIRPAVADDFEARGLKIGKNERAYTLQVFQLLGPPELSDIVVARVGHRWIIRAIRPALAHERFEVVRSTTVE